MKKQYLAALLAAAILAFGVAPLLAQDNIVIHLAGFGYEEGTFDFSNPGDEIHLLTRVTNITGPEGLPFDFDLYEYTLVVTGLISNGEVVENGISTIEYNLGLLQVFEDDAFNSDYGINPDVASPPGSFFDGTEWVSGYFNSFVMQVDRSAGLGSFYGTIQNLTGGSAGAWFQGDAYTFGGTLDPPHNPDIPEGYDIAIDGEVWAGAIATQNSSMSHIKALY
jgi:hypothetical protein